MLQAAVVASGTAAGTEGVPVVVDGASLVTTTGPGGRFALYVPRTAVAPGAALSYGPNVGGVAYRASLPMPSTRGYVINGFRFPYSPPAAAP